MYFPKSQIKTNLYTNGDKFLLSTTKEPYTGYYYEISDGSKYTGKNPNDQPNILLIPPPPSTENEGLKEFSSPSEIVFSPEDYFYQFGSNTFRLLPQFNPTLPTSPEQSLGVFTRYFCKKNNELKYIETNKTTYDQLKAKDPNIAWDLYTPLEVLWNIKGTKEQVTRANKTTIALLEQRQKWYGFSQYLKEDYLKYYVGV
jgi:hypothetical protein